MLPETQPTTVYGCLLASQLRKMVFCVVADEITNSEKDSTKAEGEWNCHIECNNM